MYGNVRWPGLRQVLGVLLPGLFILVISLVGVHLATDIRTSQEALRDRQHKLLTMVDASRGAQLYYIEQQDSWSNLLREVSSPELYAHYLREYLVAQNLVQRQLEILRELIVALELDPALVDRVVRLHNRLAELNAEAVELKKESLEAWKNATRRSYGLTQHLNVRFSNLIGSIVLEANRKIMQQNEASEVSWQRAQILLLGLTAMGVSFTSLIAYLNQLASRRLSRTLNSLQRTQQELVRSEKLAALGALVAGVAHELNTPLGNSITINSTLADMLREFSKGLDGGSVKRSDLTRFCEEAGRGNYLMQQSLERAVEIVGNFKEVAVDQSSDRRRVFDLKTVVEEIAATLAPQFKHTPHDLKTDIPEGIKLDSYPGALGQILNNLVLNALRHAFEEVAEGLVLISAKRLGDDEVLLRISDNGCGIPGELHTRIFDPFYTTRLGKGGSGMGLYIVHNLATGNLGGSLKIDPTTEEGAAFDLAIPLTAPEDS